MIYRYQYLFSFVIIVLFLFASCDVNKNMFSIEGTLENGKNSVVFLESSSKKDSFLIGDDENFHLAAELYILISSNCILIMIKSKLFIC
ncbi:MAG: hypothetical protein IPO21_20630 [Bacteroidales bacterium]|nr:hypothetical protein [Bacteroidales bacterium]